MACTLLAVMIWLGGCLQATKTGAGSAPEIQAGRWFHTDNKPTSAALRGKLVFLYFFATDCADCTAPVMPRLNALQSDWEDRDLVVVALTHEQPVIVEQFVHARPVHFTVGAASNTAQKYGVTAIPYGILIGRDGEIAWEGDPREGLDEAVELVDMRAKSE